MVSRRCVTRAVRAPVRADAAAASQPAWPPPTTMTSKSWSEGECDDLDDLKTVFRMEEKPVTRRSVAAANMMVIVAGRILGFIRVF